jgi:membrane-bound lytic murein transglycosylase D
VADLTETPLSEIQALNPALLKNVAPAGYQVNVPQGTANTLIASLQTVPPDRRAAWRMHRVESGETLATIGKRYGAPVSAIAAVNRLESDAPEAGDRLVIPQAAPVPKPVWKPRANSTTSRKGTPARVTLKKTGAPSSSSAATAKPRPKPKTGPLAKASRKKTGSMGGS